jgi:tetratricopeptide (TPR) repeat protein
MTLFRLVPFCFLAIGFCTPICSAQANRVASVPMKLPLTVSVRELSIPLEAGRAFDRGTQLLAAKAWAGSISEFRRAIKAFPTFYEAFYRIGIAEGRLGHAAEAESAFRKSLALSADRYAPAHFGLGMILSEDKKQYAEAESMVHSGLAIDPKDGGGYFALGWILFRTDRLPDAESAAREALLREPGLAVAYVLLAQVHLRQSKPNAVNADLDAYLKLDPSGVKDSTVVALRTQAEQIRSLDDGASVLPQEQP